MRTTGRWSALLLLLALLAPLAAQADPPNRVLPGIWRLHGSHPGLPTDDLEPLRELVGKASVVAMGESVHASGGYYEMKHRVFRYLVEEMGFRVFALENPWISTDVANQYVQTCQGTPEDALLNLRLLWLGGEIRDMLQWMCEWNQAHPDPKDRLHFYGFDIQFQQRPDINFLTTFLGRIGIPATDPRVTGLTRCDGYRVRYNPFNPYPTAAYQQCSASLDAIEALFNEQEREIERQTSREDLAWARIRLIGQRASQNYVYLAWTAQDVIAANSARDVGMAYAFREIRNLRFSGAKTLLWAHNHHISRNSSDYNYVSMGTLLSPELGEDLVSIALVSRQAYADFDFAFCGPLDPARPGSVEDRLSQLGESSLLVNLHFPGGHPPFLEPGATYELSDFAMVPRRQFDALIFQEVSRKMTAIFWESPCP